MMKLNNYSCTKVDLSEKRTKEEEELCALKNNIKLISIYMFVLSVVLLACNLVNKDINEHKKDYFYHTSRVTQMTLKSPER